MSVLLIGLLSAGHAGIVDVLTVDHDVVRAQPRAVRREVGFCVTRREAVLAARNLAHAGRRSRQRKMFRLPMTGNSATRVWSKRTPTSAFSMLMIGASARLRRPR